MSTKAAAPKQKPGRPKKVSSVQPSEFRGIISEKPVGCDMEFVFPYTHEFKRHMGGFHTCEVKDLFIHFSKDMVRLSGYVAKNNTSVDSPNNMCKDALCYIITPAKILSYYCNGDYYLQFKITDWDNALADIDESCDKITIRYASGSMSASFESSNSNIGCVFKHEIQVYQIHQSMPENKNNIKSEMAETKKNAGVIFENVACKSFKKILTKQPRKKSTGATLAIGKTRATITFPIDNKDSHMEIPISQAAAILTTAPKKSKEEIKVTNKTGELATYNFPNTDISKFMIHVGDAVATIYFCQKSMLIRINSESSIFAYYKDLSS